MSWANSQTAFAEAIAEVLAAVVENKQGSGAGGAGFTLVDAKGATQNFSGNQDAVNVIAEQILAQVLAA